MFYKNITRIDTSLVHLSSFKQQTMMDLLLDHVSILVHCLLGPGYHSAFSCLVDPPIFCSKVLLLDFPPHPLLRLCSTMQPSKLHHFLPGMSQTPDKVPFLIASFRGKLSSFYPTIVWNTCPCITQLSLI